jgi:hypothetical protein
MKDEDFTDAKAIARALNASRTDPNEVASCVAFLNEIQDGERFFTYLDTVIREGQAVVRSKRTLGYYRAIRKVCRQHLRAYQDDPPRMAQMLGWAVRLMRYYAVTEKRGKGGRR